LNAQPVAIRLVAIEDQNTLARPYFELKNPACKPSQHARKAVGDDGVERLPAPAQPPRKVVRQQRDAHRVVRGKGEGVQRLRQQQRPQHAGAAGRDAHAQHHGCGAPTSQPVRLSIGSQRDWVKNQPISTITDTAHSRPIMVLL
jgi:hypothetical protein